MNRTAKIAYWVGSGVFGFGQGVAGISFWQPEWWLLSIIFHGTFLVVSILNKPEVSQ